MLNLKQQRRPATVVVNGIQFVFDEDEGWHFIFRNVRFCGYDNWLECPTVADLERTMAVVESERAGMLDQIRKHFANCRRRPSADSGKFEIVLTHLVRDNKFDVTWFGGERWRNTTVDFRFENWKIVGEVWDD